MKHKLKCNGCGKEIILSQKEYEEYSYPQLVCNECLSDGYQFDHTPYY